MSDLIVKFIGKEYSIPQDVLTYIELLGFVDNVQKQLANAFVRKLKIEIQKNNTGLLGDEDLAEEIEQQVGKYIAKLCDNGIFTRTIGDYLNNNKGYQYVSDVNKAALEKFKSLLMQRLDSLQEGYTDAVQRAESHVTGMGFSIWSGSFVNHAIYAAMQASTINKQEKEASAAYQREINELCTKLESDYDRQISQYIHNEYIPNMEAAFTVLAYELLDSYIVDLIESGKFNKAALDFVNIERSNDLLKNLTLSNNKQAILENAFTACPYNIAVYMHAMKLEMLDVDTFGTANVFKQGSKILSFLKESLGAADYPNFVEPNYYSASLLARYENKSTNDVLYQHTSSYANTVIREYDKIVKALNNSNQCREYLRKLNDDEILSGEGTSKRLAKSLVYSIVPNDNWNILVKQCGHADLLQRLQAIMPVGLSLNSKLDCDSYLAEVLFNVLEVTRKDLAQKISESLVRAEAEQQKLEAQKRKKRIKTTAIVCAIVAIVIFVTSLLTIIENAKIAKRESHIEKQIQEVVMPLERQIEEAAGVDIIIDYSFSLENDWNNEQWYEWTFSVKLPVFEEYRRSNNATEQALLEVMNVCKTAVEIYDNVYDELDFDFNTDDIRIVLDYSGGNFGSLKIHDMSTSETFYYEKHGENQYLHSSDTEYVLTGYDESNFKLDDYSECAVGDEIRFGRYEQDGNTKNGVEAIEWIVLEVKEGKALIISKYILDAKSFHNRFEDTTWEESSIRSWLNNTFLSSAFNAVESNIISLTNISNDKNGVYNIPSGNATQDRIFLLNIAEFKQYFTEWGSWNCEWTAYALSKVDICFGDWWLRTSEEAANKVSYVDEKDGIVYSGDFVSGDDGGVRPAMWIEINK